MQKVVGSNPISRFREGRHLQAFCVRSRLVRLRRVGLIPDLPRDDRRLVKENALFAGRFSFVRTEVLLPACRRSSVLPAAAVSPTLAATPRSCGQRPPARYRRSRSSAPVRFQSGNREVNLAPLRDPARHGPQSRELSPQDGVRGSGAVPITGGSCRGSHTGSSPKVSLSIGKQASARTWAGLLLNVHCDSRISAPTALP
jgi:hypothetical protein